MVPAPRRCLRCIQATVQCDGNSPCARCKKTRLPCRWARRTPETQETPALAPRSRSVRSSSSSSSTSATSATSATRSPSQELLKVSRAGRSDARSAVLLPIDEAVAPSLVAKAASLQQTQVYINFVLAAFPCYFKATETRVPINWVEYVDARHGGSDAPFDWAIRSLTAIYTGSLHNDPRYLDAGRDLYLRSLRGLSNLLSHISTAKSDEALSTAIALLVYEMHSCTTAEGWTHHASGIRALMQLRGPKAHRDGFGCALYIACRNTLITAALVSGEECFLEEPEWQALNEHIAAENAKQPDSSVYTDIAERAFREVVRLPGFVRRMRGLQGATAEVQRRERPALLHQILAVRATLRGIHTDFSMSVSTLRAGHEPQTDFIGPIPHHFFDGFSKLSIQGLRHSILLLNYLIIILDPSQRPAAEAENRIITDQMRVAGDMRACSGYEASSPLTPPGSPGRPSLAIESKVTPETRQPPTTDWMDRIATTMGMEGVRISLVDDG